MSLLHKMKQFVAYKWLLEELVIRDLKLKYRRSILGYFWSILNPLMMMVILTIVFSNMFRFDIPNYPVYLLAGQLIYSFFAESTSMAMGAILGSASLIKKVYLPKYIFPLSRILSCFITTLCSLVALFIVMILTGTKFSLTLILLPVILSYILIFCIGMGLILSVLIVFFRDIQHFYGVFLTGFNYLTPIFYPAKLLPSWLYKLLPCNPLYNFIDYFRKIVVYGIWPTLEDNLICLIFSFCIFTLGIYVFKKNQNKFILYI